MIDLDRLERLIKAATPLPWHKQSFEVYGWKNKRRVFIAQTSKPIMQGIENIVQRLKDADYIEAACNALPGLIAENRALRARVQELERQREWLAKFVASYVDCNQCPYSEDVCTPQAHVDCCSLISQKAEQATKEAGE